MTVHLDHRTIRLEGNCYVEDAEPLLALLQGGAGRAVDVSAVGTIHAAVLQLLLIFRPQVVGANSDAFFNRWIQPVLAMADDE